MDRGTWWATVHGVAKRWTPLKQPSTATKSNLCLKGRAMLTHLCRDQQAALHKLFIFNSFFLRAVLGSQQLLIFTCIFIVAVSRVNAFF